MTTKQLRHCSAHVNINEGMFCNSYELVSYSTPVALLGIESRVPALQGARPQWDLTIYQTAAYGAVAYHHHCYSLDLTMNAYSTANHTITFTINTIDDDEFLKTIEGHNFDGRIWRNDTNDEWGYLRTNGGKYHIIMARVEDVYCLDADALIKQITNSKNQAIDNYNATIEALNNFDALKEEYNSAVKTLKEIGAKIPAAIAGRYSLDSYSVKEWGNYFSAQLADVNIIGASDSPYFLSNT